MLRPVCRDYYQISVNSVIRLVAISKKKPSAVWSTVTIRSHIRLITRWVHENQNWVYIAIIGFCLSVTVLYKISQW